jgi:hypothetical protein
MSLPSIKAVAQEMSIDLEEAISFEQQEQVLVGAMKRDLSEAWRFLHDKSHEAEKNSGSIRWTEDPKSKLGQQLIRIHASDALRPLASKHACHGKPLTFINCCSGVVGKPPAEPMLMQIRCQAGPIAYSDC